MPPLSGFSDNSLQTRDDLVKAAEALLKPLTQYFSPAHARIRLPHATGTHFDEVAAQLEGFARPLWAIGALLMGGESSAGLIDQWIEGFEAGVDPEHPEYWGDIKDMDQRMVEAEMVSFSLLAAPRHLLWDRFSTKTQRNLAQWLLGMHGKAMPPANWLWFRVFANLALLKVCEIDTPEIRQSMEDDLDVLDSMYICDGWSGDGVWRSPEVDEEEYQTYLKMGRANSHAGSRNVCYYSGSFAIQFSQLLYIRFAGDLDPKRTEKYRQQARDFGRGFVRFFDADGAAIPFGRSLTYRFACGGYFAALALAKVPDMPEPLESVGSIKGYLLRHLRWWAANSENIFYPDGTLNFGWTYPNMYLTEDYNSPQSVYWALKSLVVVGLTDHDPFWSEPEVQYQPRGMGVKVLPAPRHIMCNHPEGNHHFMLSTSQFIAIPFKGVVSKYSKFAYSSSFAFSVPTGQVTLNQLVPDNTLALSRDGTETWAVKYKGGEASFVEVNVCGVSSEKVSAAMVSWYPWADRSVVVDTILVPPSDRWPDWHIRVHRLRFFKDVGRLFTAEGGFAVNGRRSSDTLDLPILDNHILSDDVEVGVTEGIFKKDSSVLILSSSGLSGICTETLLPSSSSASVSAFKPEANTNLMTSRSLIPLIEHNLHDMRANREIILITKVFAVSGKANRSRRTDGKSSIERWLDQPQIHIGKQPLQPGGDCVHLYY